MRSQVKVHRLNSPNQNDDTENYTFDLNLETEEVKQAPRGQGLFISVNSMPSFGVIDEDVSQEEEQISSDKVDELMNELEELMGFKQETVSSKLLYESNNSQVSKNGEMNDLDIISPELPRRASFRIEDSPTLLEPSIPKASDLKQSGMAPRRLF